MLKFSALEIYNETVVDILNRESGSLRLLDDREVTCYSLSKLDATDLCITMCSLYVQRGTLVYKLTEEVVKDDQHLRHLIRICEGDTEHQVFKRFFIVQVIFIAFFSITLI